jgi:hypothetical protein
MKWMRKPAAGQRNQVKNVCEPGKRNPGLGARARSPIEIA